MKNTEPIEVRIAAGMLGLAPRHLASLCEQGIVASLPDGLIPAAEIERILQARAVEYRRVGKRVAAPSVIELHKDADGTTTISGLTPGDLRLIALALEDASVAAGSTSLVALAMCRLARVLDSQSVARRLSDKAITGVRLAFGEAYRPIANDDGDAP